MSISQIVFADPHGLPWESIGDPGSSCVNHPRFSMIQALRELVLGIFDKLCGPKRGLIGPNIRQNKLGVFLVFLVFFNIIMKGFGGFNYSKMAN